MKQIRWIIILAVTALVLGGIFIVVDRRTKEKDKEKNKGTESKQLLSINADSVTRIVIDNEEGHFAFDWDMQKGGWKLVSSDQFRINEYAISGICTYICDVKSVKTVAFDCENTSAYGFDNPVTIKVYTLDTDEEHPYILHVGDSTPTHDAYYVMVDGSDDVYTVDYNTGSIFCAAKNTLRNTYLFDFNASQLTYYKLERSGKVISELKRNASNDFELITPAGYETSKLTVDDLTNLVIRVQVTEFLEEHPEDLAKYGLKDPWAKLSLEAIDDGATVKEEMWFGDMTTDSDNAQEMYGYFTSTDQVFKVLRADVQFLEYDAKKYISPYCVTVNIEDLSGIDVDLGEVYDLHETLSLDYANGQYALGSTDIDAFDDEDLMQQYIEFFRSIAYLTFTDTDFDAKPEGDAAMSITYHYLDGKDLALTFIPAGDKNYYLMKNGTYTGQTVRLNAFTGTGCMTKVYTELLNKIKNHQ